MRRERLTFWLANLAWSSSLLGQTAFFDVTPITSGVPAPVAPNPADPLTPMVVVVPPGTVIALLSVRARTAPPEEAAICRRNEDLNQERVYQRLYHTLEGSALRSGGEVVHDCRGYETREQPVQERQNVGRYQIIHSQTRFNDDLSAGCYHMAAAHG